MSTLALPPIEIRFMAEDDEKFMSIANENATQLQQAGLQANHTIVDIGCGYGRLVYGLEETLRYTGDYLGFDILPKHVKWCQKNIHKQKSNYRFDHLDIQNDRYNPKGKLNADSWAFDNVPENTDFACLFSVFTHMYESEIRNYLTQIFRVLRRGGKCMATFFLFDDDRLTRISKPDSPLCMTHELNSHTRYHNAQDPLHAICYDVEFIKEMAAGIGFSIEKVNFGSWAGGKNSYQDYLVLLK